MIDLSRPRRRDESGPWCRADLTLREDLFHLSRGDLVVSVGKAWKSTLRTRAGWANPVNGIAVHEWRCDRCGAEVRQPCRTQRSGKRRRIAHLTRWSTAVVFTLATRWLPRLPVRDRLVLATRAVGEPVSTREEGPAAWTDVTALLWQADLLQKALVQRVVDDSDGFVDVEELRRPGIELAAAMKEAGNLLRQLHMQDDPRLPEVDVMVLPDLDGPERRRSLAELRAARDLGQVHVVTADMSRRAAAVVAATGTGAGAGRWAVRWEPSGRFDAEPVSDDGADRPAVRGWAAHPAVVADELGRWGTRPRHAEVTWQGAAPSPTSSLCAFTPAAVPRITEDQATAAFMAQPARLAEVVAAIDAVRRSFPPARVRDEVAARAARLQAEEPQLPDLFPLEDPWVCTSAAEWVRTRAVVRTPDAVWGRFDRDEPERQADWIPERAAELLAVRYADVPAYLTRHFAVDSGSGAVQLQRVPGPAGPLFAVGSGGSHRAHLCRILGLPWMFAVTTMMSLPRRIETTAVTPSEHGPEGCRATAELWRGLLDHGIVRGELIPRYSDWVVELRLGYALAPWMLLPADRATTYNQRYELLYPGALAAAGIPDVALRSPSAWRSWVTGR
jgi:hypothetical protein